MSDVRPEFLTDEGFLVEGRSTFASTGGGLSVFTRSALVSALWAYGEDEALAAVQQGLDRAQVREIGVRDAQLLYEADPCSQTGRGYPGDKALALATIEVLEGQPRELARKRRRPPMPGDGDDPWRKR